MKRTVAALCAGLLFGAGLLLSGMTDRLRVQAFLDVTGAWDPRLLWVMACAILVFAPAYALGRARAVGPAARVYQLPTAPVVDARLVAGAVLFGVGWGLVGYCPGPAVIGFGAALTRLDPSPIVFGVAMLAGMALHRVLARAGAETRAGAEREDA